MADGPVTTVSAQVRWVEQGEQGTSGQVKGDVISMGYTPCAPLKGGI